MSKYNSISATGKAAQAGICTLCAFGPPIDPRSELAFDAGDFWQILGHTTGRAMDAGRVPNKVYDMETPNSLKQVIFRLDRRARAAKAIDDGAHRDTGYELGAERRQQVRLDRLDRQAALQRVLKARFTT